MDCTYICVFIQKAVQCIFVVGEQLSDMQHGSI